MNDWSEPRIVAGDDLVGRKVNLAGVGSEKCSREERPWKPIEISVLDCPQERDFDLGARGYLLERKPGAFAFCPQRLEDVGHLEYWCNSRTRARYAIASSLLRMSFSKNQISAR